MLDKTDGITKVLLSILLFPLFFQNSFIQWAWGTHHDEWFIIIAKRILAMLPILAIIAGCWLTIIAALSTIVRQNRKEFLGLLILSWWDLGRAILIYWGGIIKFILYLIGSIIILFRLLIITILLSLQDIILLPLNSLFHISRSAFKPGIPWIAAILTVLWSILEALIFTFITTGLVTETLNNITEAELNINLIRIILFAMLFAFVLGSYSILATLEQAFKTKNIKQIFLVFVIELLALIFEVMFLYREFIDALIPWFAQYAGENFQMGIVSTLFLATIIWAGIRGMTWFLFAQHGTVVVLACIQRSGTLYEQINHSNQKDKKEYFVFISALIEKLKKDINWIADRGEHLLSAFIVPPLQIVAVVINFSTLIILGEHIFNIPSKSYKELLINIKDISIKFKDK